MSGMKINEYIKQAHKTAVEKGFYDCTECQGKGKLNVGCSEEPDIMSCPDCGGSGESDRNIGELLMLIISELGEALEAHRKNRFADFDNFDKLIEQGSNKTSCFEMCIKDTFEDEISDVFIRLFDLCGYLGIEPILQEDGFSYFANVGELLFSITKEITNYTYTTSGNIWAGYVFTYLLSLCDGLHINIEKHIEAKMKYNLTRKYKHGKEY